jgi:serine/threonine-protein kinase
MNEREIFEAALEMPPEERRAYLDGACGENTALRQRLRALLGKHDHAGSFLEKPAVDVRATVDEQPISERPGTIIGSYKLLEQIGEGGFGVVFMAEQMQPVRRKVALKVLKPGMDTRQVVARFEAERQALALMDHPNIARVFEGGETASGRPYFVMELVKGLPITNFCDQSQLPVRERLELFISVCQAVQHAHQKGVIHRDVKPSNVLVTLHDGTPLVKVIDFGIAKALGQQLTDKTLFTQFTQMIGTPLYMSPEQAALSNLDVDTRSDVYSLGVLMYELLTGTTPFDRERLQTADYDEIRRIIREEEPPRPSTRISTLGQAATTVSTQRKSEPGRLSRLFRGELDWVVMKALEKDRNRRYESASALAADVQRYLNDEAVQECPPAVGYRLRKFVRRNRTALALAGSVLFVVVSLGAGAGWAVRDRLAREQGMAHDRQEREAALDAEVSHALDEAEGLSAQEKWPEALAAVGRADKLLASAGRTERPARLLRLQNELSMAERLEHIYRGSHLTPPLALGRMDSTRLEPTTQQSLAEEDFFAGREQDARFTQEFQNLGIEVDALDPSEAAARVGRTSVRPALVKALDEWAMLRRRARGDEDPSWRKLVETARQADPDTWRDPFRAALLGRDRQTLEKLADSIPIRDVPPITLYLLGAALKELGAPERAWTVARQAQRQYPDDFWLNDQLAWYSWSACQPPRYDDALRHYMTALALRPRQPRLHEAVAELLQAQGALDEAIAQYSRAIELSPNNPVSHYNRGDALYHRARLDEAIAEFREALRLKPEFGEAHINLGLALRDKGATDEAIAECLEGIRCGNSPVAHSNLGFALYDKGQLDEAIVEFREAIRLDKNFYTAHNNLAAALRSKGQIDEAIAELREAMRIKPDSPDVHSNLGLVLRDKGLTDEAIAECREAVRLKNGYSKAHNDLGMALKTKGDVDGAIAEFHEAIRLNHNEPSPHFNLGVVLMEKGQWRQAAAEFRRAHDLGAPLPQWARAEASSRLRRAERLAELDERLPAVLRGRDRPKDAAEQITFARFCQGYRKQYVAAVRFYADAFSADPQRAEDWQAAHRYNAARAAALASGGQGLDADSLDNQERARLRRQALDWLRADLEAWRGRLTKEPPRALDDMAGALRRWLTDPDLAGVRGPEALARVPEEERQLWQRLWSDIAAAEGKAAAQKKTATK